MNGKGVGAKAQIYLRDFCRGPGRDNSRLNLGDDKDFGKRWTMLRYVIGKLADTTNKVGA